MSQGITLKKMKQQFFMLLANLPVIPGHKWRPLFVRVAGVQVLDYRHTFIGKDVLFDSVHPEMIIVESGVRLTARTAILTHYINPQTGHYDCGEVRIKKNAFIGLGTIITKPITIGEDAVIGAGSIVTKSVPDGEIWAGNPARVLTIPAR